MKPAGLWALLMFSIVVSGSVSEAGAEARGRAATLEDIPVLTTREVLVTPAREAGTPPEVLAFLQRVRHRILQEKNYPFQAKQMRLEGTTTVGFTILPDGHAGRIEVKRTSGYSILDEAAVDAVGRVLPLRPPPEAGNRPMDLEVPISFVLQ